jgi:glutamyl-Q tRNA(Asp) synthetase
LSAGWSWHWPRSNLGYIGRFAPSPTGPLHAGSLVAALASWLDAKAHGGQWLVRIEDVDTPRCIAGADLEILRQLAECGLHPDAPPTYQSQRGAHYQAALDSLLDQKLAYPCTCSRSDIEAAWRARGVHKSRHAELVYPGTCRTRLRSDAQEQPSIHAQAQTHRTACSVRFCIDSSDTNRQFSDVDIDKLAINSVVDATSNIVHWTDRRLGVQQQNLSTEVGDFVLRRADGLWAYQLALVVDDAHQGITHVVRGADLADNTARQIALQRALGYNQPQYLHTPLVLAADGQKLSKQNGAAPLDSTDPKQCLREAAQVLGLNTQGSADSDLLAVCLAQWRSQYCSA